MLFFSVSVYEEQELPHVIFRISFFYFCLMGCIILMVVGMAVSYATRSENDEPTHPDLLSPVVYWMLPEDYKFPPSYDQTIKKPTEVITYVNGDLKEKEALEQLKPT